MSQPLPVGDFRWENPEKFVKHKGRGYIAEVNLEHSEKCKIKTNKYPSAPDRIVTKREELSQYQLHLLGEEKLSS
jgi:hypothetical protein